MISRPDRSFNALLALVDQLTSSLSSLVVTAIVANLLTTARFGLFAILYACIVFAVGLGRAGWSEAAVVLTRDSPSRGLAHISSRGELRWLQLTVLSAPIVLAAVLVVGPVAWLNVSLWLLLATSSLGLADSARMRFIVTRRPAMALVVSGSLVVAHLAILGVGRPDSVEAALMLLALSTSIVVIPTTVKLLISNLQDARSLLTRYNLPGSQEAAKVHGRRFAVEYLAGAGGYLVATLVASAVGGLTTAAALRGAEVVLGPFRVVATVLPTALISAFPLKTVDRKFCLVVGFSLAAAAGAYVIALLWPLSDVVVTLLGESASVVMQVLPWLGLALVMICLSTGAIVGLRASLQSARSLRVRATAAPVLLVACGTGAIGGPVGAAVGMSAASAFAAIVWWRSYRLYLRYTD